MLRKPLWPGFLTLLLVLSLALPAAASVVPGADEIAVHLNGKAVVFPDTRPLIQGGRTLVPIRAIAEALGARVDWDAATRTATVTMGSTTVTLSADVTAATVNGKTVVLDVPATIVGGRILVPLRFLAEALGARVEWHADTRTVTIGTPPAPPAAAGPGQSGGNRPAPRGDPAALALLEKAMGPSFADVRGTLTMDMSAPGQGAMTIDVEMAGAVRGQDLLMEMTTRVTGVPEPAMVAVAARNGRYWVQTNGQWAGVSPDQGRQLAGNPGLDALQQLDRVAQVRLGGTRTVQGVPLQEVIVEMDGAAVQELVGAAAAQAGGQLDIGDFGLVFLFGPGGSLTGMEMDVQGTVAAQGVAVNVVMHLDVTYKANKALIIWPAGLK